MEFTEDLDETVPLIVAEFSQNHTQRVENELETNILSLNRKKPVAYLKVFDSSKNVKNEFPIFPGENFIGRSKSSNVCLTNQSISKKHACIEISEDSHFVYDCGSVNNTKRNSLILKPNVRYELTDGVSLKFADVECTFCLKSKFDSSPDSNLTCSGVSKTQKPLSSSLFANFSKENDKDKSESPDLLSQQIEVDDEAEFEQSSAVAKSLVEETPMMPDAPFVQRFPRFLLEDSLVKETQTLYDATTSSRTDNNSLHLNLSDSDGDLDPDPTTGRTHNLGPTAGGTSALGPIAGGTTVLGPTAGPTSDLRPTSGPVCKDEEQRDDLPPTAEQVLGKIVKTVSENEENVLNFVLHGPKVDVSKNKTIHEKVTRSGNRVKKRDMLEALHLVSPPTGDEAPQDPVMKKIIRKHNTKKSLANQSTETMATVEPRVLRRGKRTSSSEDLSNRKDFTDSQSGNQPLKTYERKKKSKLQSKNVETLHQSDSQDAKTKPGRKRGGRSLQKNEIDDEILISTLKSITKESISEIDSTPKVGRPSRARKGGPVQQESAKKQAAPKEKQIKDHSKQMSSSSKKELSIELSLESSLGSQKTGPKRKGKLIKQDHSKYGSSSSSEKELSVSTPSESSQRSQTTRKRKSHQEILLSSCECAAVRQSPRKKTKLEICCFKISFTGIAEKDVAALSKIAFDLEASVEESLQHCTHLVAEQVKRTAKFLCAVGRGIPIVTPDWLKVSKKSGSFKDFSTYLLRDVEAEKKFCFCLKTTLDLARLHPLLSGFSVYVTPSVKPPPNEMKDIIICAGGKFLPKLPKRNCDEGTFAVSCQDDKEMWPSIKKLNIQLVSSECLLSGLLKYELDFNQYNLITTGEEK